ncbi:MAG: hypothetical protein AB7O67_12260 [Vicinamibacterales bacterium]
MRVDAVRALRAFVDGHAGLRFGTLFGVPAAFAGRRAFAKVEGAALLVRVPPAAHDFARRAGAVPARQGRGWLRFSASGGVGRLVPLLEVAAQAAATATTRGEIAEPGGRTRNEGRPS